MRAALDGILLASIRPIAAGLAVLFLALGASKLVFATAGPGLVFVAWDVALASAFLAIGVAMRRPVEPRHAHAIAAAAASLLLADALLFLVLVPRPLDVVSFILIMLGVSFFFTSGPWFAGFIAVTLGSYATAVTLFPHAETQPTLESAIYLLDALVLSVLAFVVRVRMLRRLKALRILDARRAREREAAVKELEAFTRTVSHDLRAPLRGVDYFTQLLADEHADGWAPEAREALAHARREVRRMTQLIDDLLQLSRAASGELHRESVDVSAIARSVLEDLRERTPGRDVEAAIEDDIVVDGDARLLRVVLENLLGNAWKYTAKAARPRIEVGARAHEGTRAVYVRDNGVGFDPARADRLFEPFQRLHAQGEFEGTGVGLATVQRIVSRHGGHVWAESTPGKGATFWFVV